MIPRSGYPVPREGSRRNRAQGTDGAREDSAVVIMYSPILPWIVVDSPTGPTHLSSRCAGKGHPGVGQAVERIAILITASWDRVDLEAHPHMSSACSTSVMDIRDRVTRKGIDEEKRGGGGICFP